MNCCTITVTATPSSKTLAQAWQKWQHRRWMAIAVTSAVMFVSEKDMSWAIISQLHEQIHSYKHNNSHKNMDVNGSYIIRQECSKTATRTTKKNNLKAAKRNLQTQSKGGGNVVIVQQWLAEYLITAQGSSNAYDCMVSIENRSIFLDHPKMVPVLQLGLWSGKSIT